MSLWSVRPPEFPAKVLLLGEYSVIHGPDALALPFPHFSSSFALPYDEGTQAVRLSQETLGRFAEYLAERRLQGGVDLERFAQDLAKGFYLQSSIPLQAGLGSSGALVAAVFERYGRSELQDFQELRQLLATMESFFHGQSSGLDPLVSYTGQALVKTGKKSFECLREFKSEPLLDHVYLFNTRLPRSTGHLVKTYFEELKNPQKRHVLKERYPTLVKECLHSFLANKKDAFEKAWQKISQLQLEFFRPMVPAQIESLWKEGLRSGHYAIKLCGAGGGGFFLLHCPGPFEEIAQRFAGMKCYNLLEYLGQVPVPLHAAGRG